MIQIILKLSMNLSRRFLVIIAVVYTLAVGIIHNPFGQPASAQKEVPATDAIKSITELQILNDDPEVQEEQAQESETPEIEGLLNVNDAASSEAVSDSDNNNNNGNSGNNGNSNNGGNFNGGDGGFLNGNTILSNNGDSGGNGGNDNNGNTGIL